MIHQLLIPHIYSIKHRLSSEVHWRSHTTRDIILACFAVFIMVAIYVGSRWMLEKVSEFAEFGYLPPGHILSLILMILFFMLLASCVAIAFGTLFMGQDLDLILSSPVNSVDFFFGKFFSVLLGSSWMPVVFISPLILAFGQFYSVPVTFYLWSLGAIIPYFVIPSAIALSLATFFVLVIPSNRNREAMLIVIFSFLYGIYILVDFIGNIQSSGGGTSEIIRIISILSAHSIQWLPSNWAAIFLSAWLDSEPQQIQWEYFAILNLVAVSLVSFSYLIVTLLHFRGFARSQDNKLASQFHTQYIRWFLRNVLPFIPEQIRAMIEKEIKTVSRDISQVVQLIMLMAICVVYIYNLKIFAAFESVPVQDKVWWQNFLYGSNIAIGAFITTAISTRFIFPSISLEGKGYWILQNAPMGLGDILKAKFICWLPPVVVISCVLFGAGAFAVKASVVALILNMGAAVFISLGIVGMALGMGAIFANFAWEHSSQLSAGLGNFLFMLSSTVLIFLNTGLVALTLSYWRAAFLEGKLESLVLVISSILLMSLMNALTAKFAMNLGTKALARLMD
ncbi:MAG: hypothetical protein GYA55_15015 [SAR324 cluster bacterium]|uniref:Uncharacterized protein n=1 Tax=SAR324 cluster bacterium TaxID=2024889 RepID=A0A7X9FUD9_9DELT|nr:hypothetical protein [SAR324 cluster bacterium]